MGTSRLWRSAPDPWGVHFRVGTWRFCQRIEEPLPPGELGEICLRARTNPHYPIGYWNRPEDSEAVFGGEWFHTKDAARLDEDGYVWYEGRADDVIISAGYRIGPFEVESAIVELPEVVEAAAVASPDAKRRNIVKAFVKLAPGSDGTDDLAQTCRTVRAHLRIPKATADGSL